MISLLLAAVVQQAVPAGPVEFDADRATMEPRDHRTLLDGAVRLRRSDLTVTGDHAIAEFSQQQTADVPPRPKKSRASAAPGKVAGQQLQRFTIDGHVHVERGARTADGTHAVVDLPAQTLVLTGSPDNSPFLKDGSETLRGERILLHLDNDDVDVARPRLTLRRSLPEENARPGAKAKPTAVRVEALKLFLDQVRHVARFSDDVVVHRGDAVVRSPRMDARYDASGQVTRLEMRGGVDLRQGDRRGTSRNADYDAQTREVVLTGEPRLYDRGDVLEGERIGLGLDSKEVKIDKARGSVRPEVHKDEVQR
jgi:lipopolysaccharide transport protein LptA